MSKIDHDALGLFAKKVAYAAALVILMYYPDVDNDYSTAHAISSSLLDCRANQNSIFGIESRHINLFLSVSYIRKYLTKKWNVSFRRNVKLHEKSIDSISMPCSTKFESAALHRISLSTEEETVFDIKSLSNDLLVEYHQHHLESGIHNKTDNLKHPWIPLSLKSKLLSELQIKSVSVSPIVKKFREKTALTLCDLHETTKVLRNKIYWREELILILKSLIKKVGCSKYPFDNETKNKNDLVSNLSTIKCLIILVSLAV